MTVSELESSLEAFFYKRVQMLGGYAFKFVPVVKGAPDRLVMLPGGQIHLVELKREGEKPSPAQIVFHQRLRNLGINVVTLTGREQIIHWLRLVVVEAAGPQNKRRSSSTTR